jgi:hypothetical protein
MIVFTHALPYVYIVFYSLGYLLGALLTFPVIIGVLLGCGVAIRNMWIVCREAVRQE